MIKRISATVLILTMLVMISAITPVMAVSTYLTDDFENAEDNIVNASTSGVNYYYVSDNGLFIKPGRSMWSEHISIAENKGYGDALYINCNKTWTSNKDKIRGAALVTKGITLTDKDETAGTEENAIVLRYKINIEYYNITATSNAMRLSGITTANGANDEPKTTSTAFEVGTENGKAYFMNGNRSKMYEFANNKWYTVVTKISGSGTNKNRKAYILDENNTVVLSIADTVSSGIITANSPVYFWPAYTLNTAITSGDSLVSYYIDDVSLTEYTTNQNVSIDIANTNIVNNETEVAINKSFNVAFDQEIAAVESGDVLLYKTNDSSKTPVSITVSNETFNGFTVKSDTNLDPNTSYTLDFSGITNSQGVAIDNTKTITFITVDPNKVPVKLESAKTSSGRAFADGLTGVTLDESFVLNFNSAIITPVANTDIKMYLNNADKTAVNVSVKLTNDKKSVTVTPEDTLSLATEYVIDFSAVLSDTYGAIEGISSLSFTTQARREMLYYEDDIEAANTGTLSNYESDVFSVASSPVLSVEEKAGYNNSKGIRINAVKSGNGISTKAYPLDSSERVVFEYKINVSSVSGDVGRVYVNAAGWANTLLEIKTDKYGYARIGAYSTSYPYYFRMNTWYTIICEISKTAQNIYMFDEKGKLVYDCNYSGRKVKTIGDAVSLYPIFGTGNGTINALVDDVKVYRLSDHEMGLLETKSDVSEDGMTNFIADDTINLVFNQPINASRQEIADSFELLENGTKISASAKKIDANKICIIPENMLKDATEYTVKISALKALSGNDTENAKEIKFTTKDLYSVKATQASLDITSGTLNAGAATLSIQNDGGAINDAVIVAAIYDGGRPGKLIKIKMFENMNIASGASSKSLEFDETILGVGSVEFFLYSSITNTKPLMRSYKVTR